ncbi:hypothetical protein KIH27_04915 [Mycobacterium sp. M1]|uniref:DUF3093 domain-containing protein n=1 Tax=Mycolicibacter acidiphilus TaxID=2835306 RepID=A0ABS5RH28_9MYCO|nr:hypothetical protein [Mycolicibacter acidiphilus]MBS9532929.1 hypothetical protein [Mycolicibacter acidiphilus]
MSDARLFHESGASWAWVLLGPAAAVTMLLLQHAGGYGWRPLIPLVFLVVVSGFVGLQVAATRVHASVELTEQTLREGTETIAVDDIVLVYPEAGRPSNWRRGEPEKWQEARALGELSGVPVRRTGIGLRLKDKRTVQAWAHNHRALRAALTPLVQERYGFLEPSDFTAIDDGEPE